ncbi:MAG: glutamyl-tRNA reductase [Flavobacteriales bacterium]|jgi:glutamyl-tRNA reductase
MIGNFLLPDEGRVEMLENIKVKFGMTELYYLCTCNRVELLVVGNENITQESAMSIIGELWQGKSQGFKLDAEELILLNGEASVERLMRISSSLDSMLIGEQEIITQLRKAADFCRVNKISGDTIRLTMKKVIETGKRCFTETSISENPVSIAFLAWQRLQSRNISTNARIILVGAGQIITSFSKFLVKAGYRNVTVANRSLEAAQGVARMFGGKGIGLEDLHNYEGGFDVLVSCTGATEAVVDLIMYKKLVGSDDSHKLLVDLALPYDVDQDILLECNVDYVNMHSIQKTVENNLGLRRQEIGACEAIIAESMADYHLVVEQRRVEVAMREIPQQIRDIKTIAVEQVFSKEIEKLDPEARETLTNVLAYMEKKYISVPMKMAREVITEAITSH